ncbi:MAG: Ig-like domain-containing protein [Bacilli bacterium]
MKKITSKILPIILFLCLANASCDNGNRGDSSSIASPTTSGEVNYFALSPKQLNVYVDQTVEINISTNVTGEINWFSSNEEIAVVDANGQVTGVAEGQCTIGATLSGLADSVEVNVLGDSYTVTLASENLLFNEKGDFFQNEAKLFVFGEEITTVNFTWSSANPEIASVDQSGKIVAVDYGTTTVRATCFYEGIEMYKNVAVRVKLDGDISFSQNEIVLDIFDDAGVNTTFNLAAIVNVYYKDEIVENPILTFECSDGTLASVSEAGVVTTKKVGETTINVSCVVEPGATLTAGISLTINRVRKNLDTKFLISSNKPDYLNVFNGLDAALVEKIYLDEAQYVFVKEGGGLKLTEAELEKLTTAGERNIRIETADTAYSGIALVADDIIENEDQFIALLQAAQLVKGTNVGFTGTYVLARDLNMTGKITLAMAATTINGAASVGGWNATFDGNRHTIFGINYANASDRTIAYGLFGSIGKQGYVKDLSLHDFNVGWKNTKIYGGVLAWKCEGHIENVFVSGSIKNAGATADIGNALMAAKLYENATIKNCLVVDQSAETFTCSALFTGNCVVSTEQIINSYGISSFLPRNYSVGGVYQPTAADFDSVLGWYNSLSQEVKDNLPLLRQVDNKVYWGSYNFLTLG